MSALKDFGLTLPGDGEIDLLLAYVSGDFLHIVCYGQQDSLVANFVTKFPRGVVWY